MKISNWDFQCAGFGATTVAVSHSLTRCDIRRAVPKQGSVLGSISCLASAFWVPGVPDSGRDRLSEHWDSSNNNTHHLSGRS